MAAEPQTFTQSPSGARRPQMATAAGERASVARATPHAPEIKHAVKKVMYRGTSS